MATFYQVVNEEQIQRRAADMSDPRHTYYQALLSSRSYEEYLEKTKDISPVYPISHGQGKTAITAEAEYKYVLEKTSPSWIREGASVINIDATTNGFHHAMLEIYDRATKLKPSYKPNDFKKLVLSLGGKAAADKLLSSKNPSEGFTQLFMRGVDALKLSVEYLVLQEPWRNLFTKDQLAIAMRRLDEVGCSYPKLGTNDAISLVGESTNADSNFAEFKWTESELKLSVAAYLDMARRIHEKSPVVKSYLYKELAQKIGRSEKSCEYRMQNISYVLALMGRDWIPGLMPAKNVGTNAAIIERLICELEGQLEPTYTTAEKLTVAKLRKTQISKPQGNKIPVATVSSTTRFIRDAEVKAWVLNRANANCEACHQPAPFSGIDGFPFLEVHHLRKLADGGSDTVTNAVAVCPNCHRRLHFSEDAQDYRDSLYTNISELKRE